MNRREIRLISPPSIDLFFAKGFQELNLPANLFDSKPFPNRGNNIIFFFEIVKGKIHYILWFYDFFATKCGIFLFIIAKEIGRITPLHQLDHK
ncbi:MAG: hypothetical protein ONB37_00415 [candidate division KSB1 bacterium]|nr:hypothetical protein [candidate division KSB1 bacterium]